MSVSKATKRLRAERLRFRKRAEHHSAEHAYWQREAQAFRALLFEIHRELKSPTMEREKFADWVEERLPLGKRYEDWEWS